MAVNFTKTTTFLCFLLPIWAFYQVASASSHAAPAPAVDCSSLVLNMADCLSFVTSGSTAKKPEGTCCNGLKTVLKSNAECLCEAFKNSAQFGVTLNVTKAMSLPSACHVSAPSVSNCGLSTSIGMPPALSPMALSPSAVAGAPTGSTGINGVVPAASPGSSSASACTISAASLVLTLLAAASLSLF